MANEVIQRMQNHLDALAQGIPGENIEFWYARDLQEPLGYARWENFMTAIRRAMDACESTGYSVGDHFRGVTKMVPVGSGAERPVDDFMLTRYAPADASPAGDLLAAAQNLIDHIEGLGCVDYRDKSNRRVKDSNQWSAFYVAVTDAAVAKARAALSRASGSESDR